MMVTVWTVFNLTIQTFDFLFKMFKLYIIAVTEWKVKISVTVDYADLSRNTQHVTAEIKILDPRAINPLTGIPLGFEGVQSQEFCFPVKILLAKDTKCLYKTHFTDFFEWAAKLNTVGVGPFKNAVLALHKIFLPFGRFWEEEELARQVRTSAIAVSRSPQI